MEFKVGRIREMLDFGGHGIDLMLSFSAWVSHCAHLAMSVRQSTYRRRGRLVGIASVE
jgi:hypothetical protein